jgi:hypothetical protein
MKIFNQLFNKLAVLFLSLLVTFSVFAQDGGGTGGADIKVDVNKEGGDWYTSPWVWVIGAALFILLLVALLRGNRRD